MRSVLSGLLCLLFVLLATACAWPTATVVPLDTGDASLPQISETAHYEESEDRPYTEDALHEYRDSFDGGSSRHLHGKILVHCFFVDDDVSAWRARACANFVKEQVEPALAFLVREARDWEVDLAFEIRWYCNETAPFSLTYDGTVNPHLFDGGSTKDILSQIAVHMGYASDDDMTARNAADRDYTDAVYLTFLNKAGTSYARSLYTPGTLYYLSDTTAEHAVIFAYPRHSTLPIISDGARAATVAHELLHLFGAEDLYFSIRKPLARKHYPADIMYSDSNDLLYLQVTEMTAFTVGWTDTVPDLALDETWIAGRHETGG